mmetsp:Transcript_6467/g.16029  ORF Transcript_6467/g.16029 Transcript_6467/m.16029 type:complete len:295 (-) Transcript_6467:569-1453(-)
MSSMGRVTIYSAHLSRYTLSATSLLAYTPKFSFDPITSIGFDRPSPDSTLESSHPSSLSGPPPCDAMLSMLSLLPPTPAIDLKSLSALSLPAALNSPATSRAPTLPSMDTIPFCLSLFSMLMPLPTADAPFLPSVMDGRWEAVAVTEVEVEEAPNPSMRRAASTDTSPLPPLPPLPLFPFLPPPRDSNGMAEWERGAPLPLASLSLPPFWPYADMLVAARERGGLSARRDTALFFHCGGGDNLPSFSHLCLLSSRGASYVRSTSFESNLFAHFFGATVSSNPFTSRTSSRLSGV